MKIKYIFLLFISIFFASCSDDGFLSVEEDAVNIPFSNAPTITAFLCPQDTVHKVQLTYTRPVVGKDLSREWSQNVGKAIVTLGNGEQTVTLKSGGNSSSYFTIKAKDFKVEAGKTYTLNVTTYDGQKAEATCTIPVSKVDLKKVDTKEITDAKYQEKKYLVTWQDIPNEQNYYAVYVFQKDVSRTYVRVGVEYTENSIADTGINGGQMISTKNFYMTGRQNFTNGEYRVTEIQILNTDINFYRYHKDLEILTISGDNPLVEPINIYSNIKGGFGVFAAYTRANGIFVE
jgi:hypothetical protein